MKNSTKKNHLAALLGGVGVALIVMAWALASGVDQRPIQALYLIPCISAANIAFYYAAKIDARKKNSWRMDSKKTVYPKAV